MPGAGRALTVTIGLFRMFLLGGAGDLVSKVISRVIFGVTPFRVLITRLITYLLSPLPLQVRSLEHEGALVLRLWAWKS